MIADNIQKQVIEAMKARDSIRVSTLRMLSSELKNASINKGGVLNEEEEMKVVKSEVKKRKDAIEGFEKGGNIEAADNERKEMAILLTYLPEQISGDSLKKIVEDVVAESGASSISDMGKVIGLVMDRVNGSADGKEVADLVRASLG